MALGFALVSTVGCAENAFLELELVLPPARDTHQFALVQARSAGQFPFDVVWKGNDPPAIRLGAAPVTDRLSVESEQDDVDLHVRIRYCETEGCTSTTEGMVPESRFLIEDPFYIGEHTYLTLQVNELPPDFDPETPPEPIEIDRCAVRGCVSGDSTPNYCSNSVHPCENR